MQSAYTDTLKPKSFRYVEPPLHIASKTGIMLLGLGSVWVCYFKADVLREEFSIPAELEPINILVIGYADTNGEPVLSPDRHNKMRKPLSNTVSYEKL